MMKKDFLYNLRKFHGWIHEYPTYRSERKELQNTYILKIKEKLKQNPKSIFLVLTPEHGNLGDHAIASAETKMLSEMNINYIEITDVQLNKLTKCKLLNIMNGYPIVINGGGNMGTLWFDAEMTHRRIIKSNPKSPIFIFPNTIYYENTEWGNVEFNNSIKIYNKHKNLHLYARENISYEIMNNAYENVSLVPDIVLSLNECSIKYDRKGCLLCLRNDREKTLTDKQNKSIRLQLKKIFGNDVHDTDMVVKGGVSVERRDLALHCKYAEFAKAQLVVTDRLHGMIFAAITGTPCIVIGSKSHKVFGCYEWLKDLGYIRFIESTTQIKEAYNSIPDKEYCYDNSYLQHYYDKLRADIKDGI